MRREKRRAENAKRFFVQQDRLREKRKNSSPGTTQPGYLGDDTVAVGALEPLSAATLFSARK